MNDESGKALALPGTRHCSPFALCINDIPVMRVSAECALECAGAAYHALAYGGANPPKGFSVGLRRLDPAVMARLPALAGPPIETVILDLFEQIVNGVGAQR